MFTLVISANLWAPLWHTGSRCLVAAANHRILHLATSQRSRYLDLHTQGHFLWNAGRTISAYIEERSEELVKGKTVLELGAGAGLPSLVCALNGASHTVVTDYPDAELIDNLRYNIKHCDLLPNPSNIVAEVCGYAQHWSTLLIHARGIYGVHQLRM